MQNLYFHATALLFYDQHAQISVSGKFWHEKDYSIIAQNIIQ